MGLPSAAGVPGAPGLDCSETCPRGRRPGHPAHPFPSTEHLWGLLDGRGQPEPRADPGELPGGHSPDGWTRGTGLCEEHGRVHRPRGLAREDARGLHRLCLTRRSSRCLQGPRRQVPCSTLLHGGARGGPTRTLQCVVPGPSPVCKRMGCRCLRGAAHPTSPVGRAPRLPLRTGRPAPEVPSCDLLSVLVSPLRSGSCRARLTGSVASSVGPSCTGAAVSGRDEGAACCLPARMVVATLLSGPLPPNLRVWGCPWWGSPHLPAPSLGLGIACAGGARTQLPR